MRPGAALRPPALLLVLLAAVPAAGKVSAERRDLGPAAAHPYPRGTPAHPQGRRPGAAAGVRAGCGLRADRVRRPASAHVGEQVECAQLEVEAGRFLGDKGTGDG